MDCRHNKKEGNKLKKIILIIFIILVFFLSGCWDMVEINERIYPYTVGFDINDGEEDISKLYKVSFSYPNINAIGKNATQKENSYVTTEIGGSIFDAAHHLTSKLQYPIYNKHLKVLVLSDRLARNSKHIKEIIDGINRDFVINKIVKLIITKGTAEELIWGKLNATRQQSIEGVFYSLLINRQNTSMFIPMDVSRFIGDMDRTGVSLVPVAEIKEGEVDIRGAGIFKDYELLGYLDGKENRAIAIINNELKEDGIETKYEDIGLSVLITSFKTNKKLLDSENLKIKLHTRLEGQIHEYTIPFGDYKGIDNERMQGEMEIALSNKIKGEIVPTIERLQKEFEADAIYTSEFLKKYHPKLWSQVKNNWEEVFPNIEFEVEVEVKLRRRGLTK